MKLEKPSGNDPNVNILLQTEDAFSFILLSSHPVLAAEPPAW